MPKKDIEQDDQNQEEEVEKQTEYGLVKPRRIEVEMENCYLDYAMSVIVSRALPDVRDGLKPVHRRILYAMNELGLTYSSKFRKSAAVVGEVLAKYHPHGDVAVYDSLVRMAQDFAMRYPLIKGQGNFGSLDGDQPAALRYTESKLSKISQELLRDIDKETVDFIDNYDQSKKEPTVLPAKLPNLLINGAMGIAVGMATNIPPHNLGEVCDAIVHMIDNPDCTIEDLTQYIKGPDFPTGAIIYDVNEIRNAYSQGKGKIVMRGKTEIIEDKRSFRIMITEIPYQVNKASLVSQIAELVKNKKVVGISDIRDESDRNGVRVVVYLRKDAYPKKVLNQLFHLTQLQETFHINILALVDGIKPQILTLKNILEEYIRHRQNVVTRRTQYELTRAQNRIHILEGLLLALKQIDEVIKTIRNSETREEALEKLVKKFKFTQIQANAILDMRLSNLAHLEQEKIEAEYKELQKLIAELMEILKNPQKVLEIIKNEIKILKKNYADERRTKIIKAGIDQFGKEDLIPNRKVIITMTHGDYIKRSPINTYKTQNRGGKGVMGFTTKESDLVEHLLVANNHDDILFFTNTGRVFSLKTYDIILGSRRSKGQAIVNLLQVNPNEYITGILNVGKLGHAKYLLMATEKGIIKKTSLNVFSKIRKSGLAAIKLRKNDYLRWVKPVTGEDQIIIVTKMGLSIKFLEKLIRPMGRSASGVIGIRLKPKDVVVGMDVVSEQKYLDESINNEVGLQDKTFKRKSLSSDLFVITGLGYGKRTPLKNYPLQSRGGIGIRTSRITAKTGPIVNMRIIEGTKSDVIMISQKGQVIRMPLKNVKVLGRATSGVRLMKLNQGDSVASVSILDKEPVESKTDGVNKTFKNKTIIPKKTKKKITLKKSQKPKKSVKKIIRKKTTQKLSQNKIKSSPKRDYKPRAKKSSEPNYWGTDSTLWKKKKI